MDKAAFQILAPITGPLAGIKDFPAPLTGTLDDVQLVSRNAMSGGDAVFDVNLNGVTIWSDQTQRVKIASGDKVGEKTGLGISVTENTDRISIDFDAFTSTANTVGGDLWIKFIFNESGGGSGATMARAHIGGTPQSIANDTGSPVTVQLDTVETGQDPGGWFSSTDHGFFLPSDGLYIAIAQVNFAGNSGGIRQVDIRYDASGVSGVSDTFGETRLQAITTGPQDHTEPVSCAFFGLAGALVTMRVYQNSGGVLNVQSNGHGYTSLTLVKVA